MDDRMTNVEFITVREWLGLSQEGLAKILNVRKDTLARWETGRDLIPYRVREEMEKAELDTATAVAELVAALRDASDVAVVAYRTDAEMHAARPETSHLPARWWRHVIARACQEVPGVEIVPAQDSA